VWVVKSEHSNINGDGAWVHSFPKILQLFDTKGFAIGIQLETEVC
jgi:hypothetical protein